MNDTWFQEEARLRARDAETPNNPESEYALFKLYSLSEYNLADKYLTLASQHGHRDAIEYSGNVSLARKFYSGIELAKMYHDMGCYDLELEVLERIDTEEARAKHRALSRHIRENAYYTYFTFILTIGLIYLCV